MIEVPANFYVAIDAPEPGVWYPHYEVELRSGSKYHIAKVVAETPEAAVARAMTTFFATGNEYVGSIGSWRLHAVRRIESPYVMISGDAEERA